MKTFKQHLIQEKVSVAQQQELASKLDHIFQTKNALFNFSTHFREERVNDSRNVVPVTIDELESTLMKVFDRYAKKISKLPHDVEGVIRDSENNLNIPFAIKRDNYERETKAEQQTAKLLALTVMRQRKFRVRRTDLVLKV